ncbi:hypothetical protein [Marinobacter sp. F3R11]|uniref:hypothetical protein n=1 Tax=Marinobacter sp. F3R11 TaxID=2267231 RepID=UPI0011E5A901|nr:hypothetical protein [Marinobacter sp. F3R11]
MRIKPECSSEDVLRLLWLATSRSQAYALDCARWVQQRDSHRQLRDFPDTSTRTAASTLQELSQPDGADVNVHQVPDGASSGCLPTDIGI